MNRHDGGQPTRTPGTRPPAYVIVIAASDWSKEHDPANRANLWDALHAGEDHHPDAETQPDLEAEP